MRNKISTLNFQFLGDVGWNLYMKKEHTKTKVTNFTVRDLASNIGDAGATSQQLRKIHSEIPFKMGWICIYPQVIKTDKKNETDSRNRHNY